MDTTKLVVGQEVHMESGVYCSKGNVVEVTPKGVVVKKWVYSLCGVGSTTGVGGIIENSPLMYFNTNGKGVYP
jgi:hypothetical protein